MNRVAVVIPSWNGRHLLPFCLEALARQSERELETVVVDNGSTDGTAAWLRAEYPRVRVLALSANGGFSAAVNAGLEVSRSPLVFVLNNDAAPGPDCIRILADWLDARPDAGSCQGRVLRHTDPSVIDGLGLEFGPGLRAWQAGRGERDPGPRGEPRPIAGVSACAALYRRTALEAVADPGPPPDVFDPDFFAWYEDVDLALRLARNGWSAWLVPAAECEHVGSATGIAGSWRQMFHLGRNYPLYLARAVGIAGWGRLMPLLSARALLRFAGLALHPRREAALILGACAAIPHLPRALRRHREDGRRAARHRAAGPP